MQLRDIVAAPWAITPDMYNEVQGIYARHMRGEKIDLDGLEARMGVPLANSRQPMEVVDGVAVIRLEGVLAKRANLMQRVSGGTSTQVIGNQLAQALADDQVTAIVLAVDSPGGSVDGTQQLGDAVFAARGQKPIVAHVDGMCCSAAYWIASACDRMVIDGDTTAVGSIGVICTHIDNSMAQAQAGQRVTEIKAGRFKAAGSSNGPLGVAEAVIQAQVDHTYAVFLSDVARNRESTPETVHAEMADGRVFLGRTAIEAGLVDGVSTLAALVASLSGGEGIEPSDAGEMEASGAGVALQAETVTPAQGAIEMTEATVHEKTAAVDVAAIKAAAVAGEIARVKAVRALARPGCEALIEEMASDGVTTGPEAAVRILGQLDAMKAKKLTDLQADAASATVDAAAAPTTEKPAEELNPHAIASKARTYQDAQAAIGNKVNDAEAVAAVLSGLA